MPRARTILTTAAAAAALALPASAAAATVQIDSDPLDIFLGDRGSLQVRYGGSTAGEFFDPSHTEPNAGFMLVTDVGESNQNHWPANTFTPVSAGPRTGSGTQADPFEQVTTFKAVANPESVPADIIITQTATYVAGATSFNLQWDVENVGQQATIARAQLFANLHTAGNASGVGFLEAGPPRVVGGSNDNGSAGIVEVTPWNAFEEDDHLTVFDHADGSGAGLDNTVSSAFLDNGVAVQFPDANPLAPNAPVTYKAAWRFSRPAAPAPPAQTAPPPTNTTQAPPASAPPPPPADDPLFPAGTPTGQNIADLPRPRTGRTVNIGRVSGTVLVKFPADAGGARASQNAKAQREFVPLDGSAQIPIGSEIDTRKGVLRLQSGANSTGSKTQTATFFEGMFELRQGRSRRPVTEMVLKGGSFRRACAARRSAADRTAGASRHDRGRRVRRGNRVRRLWGTGRGRFRTRGRYSSATVRGTKWLVEERCNGTLTKVARRPRTSRVDVRDLVHRRTVRLRAGQSYFAVKGRVGRRR